MNNNKTLFILFCGLLPLALFLGTDDLSLRAEEPRRAIVALEMVLGHDYIAPKINGWYYYNKPPLYNWIIAGSYQLFGSFSEWVVRFPGVISFLLLGLVHFFVARKYTHQNLAIFSTLAFVTSADLLFYGTVNAGEIDIFYSLLTYLQVVTIFHFYEKRKLFLLFTLSYFLCALGVLTKGAPSILFQGLTIIGYLMVVKRDFRSVFSFQHATGMMVFLGIAGGYFYMYYIHTGELKPYLANLLNEAVQKTSVESSFLEIVAGFFLFPINLLKLLLPWSLLVVFLFNKKLKSYLRSNDFIYFSVIFILFNLPIYWLTGKYVNRYIYMFLPFISTIFIYIFSKKMEVSTNVRWVKSWPRVFYIISLSLITFRLIFNFTYIPYVEKHQHKDYQKEIDTLLYITHNNPIYLTGSPYYFDSEISIFGKKLISEKLKTAPLIAYQIPYYLSKKTNVVMHFDGEMKDNRYYLMYHHQIDTSTCNILYTFEEGWQPDLSLSLIIKK